MSDPEVKVPQKIYRFLLKGLHYFGSQRRNCTFDDLVSYVYLKNNRQLRIDLVEKLVREASGRFVTQGLLERSTGDSFRFHEQYLAERPTAVVGFDDPDRDERLTVDPSRRKPVPVSGSESELPPAKRFRDRQGNSTTLPKYRKHSGKNRDDGLDFELVPVLEPLEFSEELEDEPGPSEIRVVEVPDLKQQDSAVIQELFRFSDSDSD
ncbi:hypothetical protein quinque_001547 [Culex quinquefasciatus]